MSNVRKFMDYSQIEVGSSSNEEFFVIPDIHGDSEVYRNEEGTQN